MSDCLFCKIIRREIPAAVVREDDHFLAFRDINPQAPTHILVIPKEHIASLDASVSEDAEVLGHLLLVAREIAQQEKITSGYRVVINNGAGAGQSVFHIHLHLLGGRLLTWPPG